MENYKPQIYHERQRLQFCLLHALNNLFQAFTRASFGAIAVKLVLDDPNKQRWKPFSIVFKPHYNSLTGNYDINVLISALEEKGKTVVWHDKRNGASSIELDSDNINGSEDSKLFGIVLNVEVRRYVGFWKSRHWVMAVSSFQGVPFFLVASLVLDGLFIGESRGRNGVSWFSALMVVNLVS